MIWFAAYAGGIFACRQLSGLYEDAPAEAIAIAFAACLAIFIAAWIFLSSEIRIYISDSCKRYFGRKTKGAGSGRQPGIPERAGNGRQAGIAKRAGHVRLYIRLRQFYRCMIYSLLAASFYLLGMVSCAGAMNMPLYEKLETDFHEHYTEGSGRIRRISEKDGRLTLYLEDTAFTAPQDLLPGQMICLAVDAASIFMEAGESGARYDSDYNDAGEPGARYDSDCNDAGKPEILPGKRVSFQGKFTLYDQASNPGAFDYRAYMRSLGICGQVKQLSFRKAKLSGRHSPVRTLLYRVQQGIKDALLSSAEPGDAGILICIISGDRSSLDQETRDLYQDAGIIHLLTVSALHITILCAGLLSFVKKLTGSKRIACLIAGISAGAFCLMAGEGTSLIRAVICFWILLAGEWFGKPYDMPTAVSAAGFWILQGSPLLLFQSGFLMTFSCCLGIGLFLGLMQDLFLSEACQAGKEGKGSEGSEAGKSGIVSIASMASIAGSVGLVAARIKRGLLAAVLLQLFTLPVLMTFNGNVSLLAPVSNLLTVPLMSLLLLSDMLGILGTMIWKPLGIFALAPAHYILVWFHKVCSFSLHWVGGSPGGWQILIWFGMLGVVLAAGSYKLTHQHRGLPYAAGLFLFPACLLILWRFPNSHLQIRILDVGQGDGIVMETPQGQVFCIDGGSTTEQNLADYVCRPYLLHEGIRRIDGWLITHTDYDHYSGMLEILKAESSLPSGDMQDSGGRQGLFQIEHVYMPAVFMESELAREIEALARESIAVTDVIYVSQGDQILLGNLSLTVLHPQADEYAGAFADPNDGSAAVLAQYGSFSALFTGDLPAEHEEEVMKVLDEQDVKEDGTFTAYGRIDVLKCGHHGSRTASSESLLDRIHPQAAIISCGLNNSYGHPHQEVLDRLDARGIETYRTDLQGCITVSVSEEGIWHVETYLDT